MIDIIKRREKDHFCWDIAITRGDSGYLDLDPTDLRGKSIVLGDDDLMHIQVREQPNGGSILFEGLIEKDNGLVWHILPENTESASKDRYFWDAQIEFSNGDVFTWVPASNFTLLPEVTEKDGGSGD